MRWYLAIAVSVFCTATQAQQFVDVPLPKTRPDLVDASPVPPPASSPIPSTQNSDDADSPANPVTERPPRVYQAACPAMLQGLVEAKLLPPIQDGICKEQSPLSVTGVRVGGRTIVFSQPAVLNCAMAMQVAQWTTRLNGYAQSVFNTGISQLHTGTSYACRSRNNAFDAPISEHGFANALDVTGVTLDGDKRITLPRDWAGNSAEAKFMRQAHTAACGAFTTVLGPDANALHADHLHLDLGCHGRNCTYMICE